MNVARSARSIMSKHSVAQTVEARASAGPVYNYGTSTFSVTNFVIKDVSAP